MSRTAEGEAEDPAEALIRKAAEKRSKAKAAKEAAKAASAVCPPVPDPDC